MTKLGFCQIEFYISVQICLTNDLLFYFWWHDWWYLWLNRNIRICLWVISKTWRNSVCIVLLAFISALSICWVLRFSSYAKQVMTLDIFTKKTRSSRKMLHKTDYCIIFFLMVFVVGSLPTPNKELLVFLKKRLLFKFKRGNPNYLSVAKITCIKNYTLFSTPQKIFSKLKNSVYTLKSQLRNGLANREKSTGNWVELSVKFCNFCWNCFIRQNIQNSLIL